MLPKEGATQGNSTSVKACAPDVLPVLHSLLDLTLTNELQTKEFAFANDLTVAGKIADIKLFWDKLAEIGPKYRYFPKPTASYPKVKKIP